MPPIMLPIQSRTINIFWVQSLISFQTHIFLVFVLGATPNPHTTRYIVIHFTQVSIRIRHLFPMRWALVQLDGRNYVSRTPPSGSPRNLMQRPWFVRVYYAMWETIIYIHGALSFRFCHWCQELPNPRATAVFLGARDMNGGLYHNSFSSLLL